MLADKGHDDCPQASRLHTIAWRMRGLKGARVENSACRMDPVSWATLFRPSYMFWVRCIERSTRMPQVRGDARASNSPKRPVRHITSNEQDQAREHPTRK